MNYKEKIEKLKAIPYSKYKDITSYEKLMLYVALVLEREKIPLTFNYLCISAFKIFPESFCCDEEFKEFPSVDRLNRTMMHLKYVKQGKPFLAGSVKDGYSFTTIGKNIAIEVETLIHNGTIDKNIKAPIVDIHKKGFGRDYLQFISGERYKNYTKTGKFDLMYIWEFFNVIPYTQIGTIKENLKNINSYAKEEKDEKCIEFVNKALNEI